jgi:hypothetical protein
MKKIQKVIETCHDCEFCKKFQYVRNDYTSVHVCTFEADEAAPEAEPFLLNLSTSKGTYSLLIPDNCPLEDYKELEK